LLRSAEVKPFVLQICLALQGRTFFRLQSAFVFRAGFSFDTGFACRLGLFRAGLYVHSSSFFRAGLKTTRLISYISNGHTQKKQSRTL
jgi:hypothetical protein